MTELSGADLAASTPAPGGLEAFARLAWGRRTSLQMDLERDVAPELVQELCEIAAPAPNHKRTWPWRFCLFTGEGRAHSARPTPPRWSSLVPTKASQDPHQVPAGTRHAARRLDVARAGPGAGGPVRGGLAALQNLLLAATAAGLASFWSSPPVLDAGRAAVAGFAEGTRIVGVVYLGWPACEVESPERPPVEVGRVTGFPARP